MGYVSAVDRDAARLLVSRGVLSAAEVEAVVEGQGTYGSGVVGPVEAGVYVRYPRYGLDGSGA
ncbi:hypothetical protein [Nocardia terpenica]|uniref:Uncharacterized protein n=1 Tax=Nocardia terpenica TaxID=455432 RepID=A0A6G9ZE92_9NOCA|nr:hypothetical protein [Nocardia terpenica]QIS23667.1 hypothetical protein F6W96_40745 [Nocardia terpenica]